MPVGLDMVSAKDFYKPIHANRETLPMNEIKEFTKKGTSLRSFSHKFDGSGSDYHAM